MSAPASLVASGGRRHRLLAEGAAYLQLAKPRVVALIVFTAVVGMLLAPQEALAAGVAAWATLGIALAASAAATLNHVLERSSDALMARTRARPLPQRRLSSRQALLFAATLAAASGGMLVFAVNALTAVLTFATLVGYSVVYTVVLKPRTPQNIVIGGAAGAAPPVLGWCAMTGTVDVQPMLLFLIVFLWTPPHFWALALYRQQEYAKAGIPMLPVTHGSRFTRASILGYTVALTVASLLPYAAGMAGAAYAAGAVALDAAFLARAWRLYRSYSDAQARRTFRFSIQYLAGLFALLLADRWGGVLVTFLASTPFVAAH